jgi:hypothetical protein
VLYKEYVHVPHKVVPKKVYYPHKAISHGKAYYPSKVYNPYKNAVNPYKKVADITAILLKRALSTILVYTLTLEYNVCVCLYQIVPYLYQISISIYLVYVPLARRFTTHYIGSSIYS